MFFVLKSPSVAFVQVISKVTFACGLSLLGLVSIFTSAAYAESYKVGLLLDKAGKDDSSFNASAFRGLQKAEKELGIESKVVEAKDAAQAESSLRALSQRKYDLIVAIGFSQADAVNKAAAALPASKFVIVDSEVNRPNVLSVMFAEHEGSYLMGVLAAMASKSSSVGFIGGMNVPLIRRFEMGFDAGAKSVNPKIKVLSSYIGVTGDAFNNPPKAKELALTQHSQGADVIFHAAGASGKGLFDAADEKKFLAIGVDSNQNNVKPGRVLTSMLKRVDVAVFEAIKQAKAGQFKGGQVIYHGFTTGGVDWTLDENNKSLITDPMKAKVEQVKKDIISGIVKVPDYYVVSKSAKK
jgi:basic membrane protein A